jgi:hypothetical protein
MDDPALNPAPRRIKRPVHIVRRERKLGDRYYVYAYRGGPLVMQRDGERPTIEEAKMAVEASGCYAPKPARIKKGRGVAYHRPLFIRELIKQGAESERWTYFIGEGKRAIKIGATKCVQSRLKILQAHNARKLRVLAVVRGGEVLESAYHALFAAHRQGNEWFKPHPEIIVEIEYLNQLERKSS